MRHFHQTSAVSFIKKAKRIYLHFEIWHFYALVCCILRCVALQKLPMPQRESRAGAAATVAAAVATEAAATEATAYQQAKFI